MHETRVGAEGDILWRNDGLEFLCRHGPELHRDHGIHLAMTLQNRSALVSTPTCSLTDKKSRSILIDVPIYIYTYLSSHKLPADV